MIENPFERINAYCSPSKHGKGTNIDTGAMVRDLITVAKMGGTPIETVQEMIALLWSEVIVDIAIPKDAMQ